MKKNMILRRKARLPQEPYPGDVWLDVEFNFTIKVEEYEKVFRAAEGKYERGALGIFKNNETGTVNMFALSSKIFKAHIKGGKYVLLVRKGEPFLPSQERIPDFRPLSRGVLSGEQLPL